MSFTYTQAVFESELPGIEKLILWVLAERANDKGQCFPGQARVAKDAGVSYSTAQRTLDKLIERRVVRVVGQARYKNTFALSTKDYQLELEAIQNLEAEKHQGYTRRAVATGSGKPTGTSVKLPPDSEPPTEVAAESLINQSYENQSENRSEKQSEEAEVATDTPAAWSYFEQDCKALRLLNYWYATRLGLEGSANFPVIEKISASRLETDVPEAREIVRLLEAEGVEGTRLFLMFIFTSEPNPKTDWDGWDKKCPNLHTVAKHIRTGTVIRQFRDWLTEMENLPSPPCSLSFITQAEVDEAMSILPPPDPMDVIEEKLFEYADTGEVVDPGHDPADYVPLDEDTQEYIRQCARMKEDRKKERLRLIEAGVIPRYGPIPHDCEAESIDLRAAGLSDGARRGCGA